MQPTQNTVTDPVTTPTEPPSETAIERQTPAGVLRAAAGYLHQFGWWQGDLFDDPEQSTPCACPLGAIRMTVIGTPEIMVEGLRMDMLRAFDAAVDVFADYLVRERDALLPAMPCGVTFPGDLESVVIVWNDDPDRNVGQVIAALLLAADEWDRIHGTPTTAAPVEVFLRDHCVHNRPIGACECDAGSELVELQVEVMAEILGGGA